MFYENRKFIASFAIFFTDPFSRLFFTSSFIFVFIAVIFVIGTVIFATSAPPLQYLNKAEVIKPPLL